HPAARHLAVHLEPLENGGVHARRDGGVELGHADSFFRNRVLNSHFVVINRFLRNYAPFASSRTNFATTPLTKPPDFSVPYFMARSTASLTTIFAGVSPRSSS